jgi:hypothetical protein
VFICALTLRVPQLSLLVAGPDWLTSVLAGMMGTSVWRVLAAQTAPTALLIAGPATAAGAFQLRVQEGQPWLALSSLLIIFAAGVQARRGSGRTCGVCVRASNRGGSARGTFRASG